MSFAKFWRRNETRKKSGCRVFAESYSSNEDSFGEMTNSVGRKVTSVRSPCSDSHRSQIFLTFIRPATTQSGQLLTFRTNLPQLINQFCDVTLIYAHGMIHCTSSDSVAEFLFYTFSTDEKSCPLFFVNVNPPPPLSRVLAIKKSHESLAFKMLIFLSLFFVVLVEK